MKLAARHLQLMIIYIYICTHMHVDEIHIERNEPQKDEFQLMLDAFSRFLVSKGNLSTIYVHIHVFSFS